MKGETNQRLHHTFHVCGLRESVTCNRYRQYLCLLTLTVSQLHVGTNAGFMCPYDQTLQLSS